MARGGRLCLNLPHLKYFSFFRALTVSKFGLSKADFRSRTCGAVRRPHDVRHAQLMALPSLKFENSPVTYVFYVLKQNGKHELVFMFGNNFLFVWCTVLVNNEIFTNCPRLCTGFI